MLLHHLLLLVLPQLLLLLLLVLPQLLLLLLLVLPQLLLLLLLVRPQLLLLLCFLTLNQRLVVLSNLLQLIVHQSILNNLPLLQ
ncbi:MAG: hypothetical protein CMA03_04485 [Euryarchaeota archaeon]|nr:hypothetical protein [Euryarchaeota archaeon]